MTFGWHVPGPPAMPAAGTRPQLQPLVEPQPSHR